MTAPRRVWDGLVIAATCIVVALSIVYLLRLRPGEEPTIEQVLPADQVRELRALRELYGDAGDFGVALFRFQGAEQRARRLPELEAQIQRIPGVSRTWSVLSRPRLRHGEGGFRLEVGAPESTELDRALAPDPRSALVLIALEREATSLSGARRFVSGMESLIATERERGVEAHATGAPMLRVASWDAASRDARRIVPLLVVVVLLVPLLFFRSLVAALFPLVLGALATSGTFLLYRFIEGPLNPWVLALLPIVWSVATMDAMHLYERSRGHAAAERTPLGLASAVDRSRRELLWPCLLTAFTTAASLALIAAPGGPSLFRTVGLWGAVGTLLAYALTFVLGGPLLRLWPESRPLPRWPERLARRLTLASARRSGVVVIVWLGLLVAAVALLPRLRIASHYPHVFATPNEDHFARDLKVIAEVAGSDLVPLELHVRGDTERARAPAQLVLATLGLHHYLHTLPEAKLVLSVGTLVDEWAKRDPESDRVMARASMSPRGMGGSAQAVLTDPRLQQWLRADQGTARVLVLLAPTSFARRSELMEWIGAYAKKVWPDTTLRLGGPAYAYHRAEAEGVRGIYLGVALDVALLLAVFFGLFRRWRFTWVSLVVNGVPVVVLMGAMSALGIPWSLGLLGLPVVVLGLAVDDTVHLLWEQRRFRPRAGRLVRAFARNAGAVLGTGLLLAGCLGTLARSGFRVNHELGTLLPLGLGLALAAELTLLPALLRLRFSRRRSARSSR